MSGPYREPAPKPPEPPPLVRQQCHGCAYAAVGGCQGYGWACIKHPEPKKEKS